MSRTSALKVLDHGMIGPEGTDNCHKFVDILGLRTIFPLFMKTPKKMKKTGTSEKAHEGQCVDRRWCFFGYYYSRSQFPPCSCCSCCSPAVHGCHSSSLQRAPSALICACIALCRYLGLSLYTIGGQS